MGGKTRKTGINILGDVPWGTHFCQFYQTKEDLIDILVPYFKAGLENNEFCMWITSEPLSEKEAKEAMREALPDFDRYLKRGQIEILPHEEWYLKEGTFNLQRVLKGWVDKLDQALAQEYDGLRLTGNTFWLEKKDWKNFTEYEKEINNVIGKYRMMAICSYSLDKCEASEVIDVVSNHQFALIRRKGKWELIESSERKQAEGARRESEEWHHAIFEGSLDAIFITGEDSRFVDVNEAASTLTGYSKEELKKMTIPDLHETTDLSGYKTYFHRIMEGKEIKSQAKIFGKDGTKVDTEFNNRRIMIKGKHYMHTVARDITERKKAEGALRKSENRLRSLFDTMTEGVVLIDADGQIIQANPEAVRIAGLKRSEIEGHAYDSPEWKLLRSDGTAMLPKEMAGPRTLKEKRPIKDMVMGVKKPNGNISWININTSLLKKETGKIDGVVLTFSDITERKRAEEALRESEEKYRSLFDNMLEGFAYCKIIVDKNSKPADFEYIEVNYAFETLTGLKKESVTGKRATEAIPGIKKTHPELFKIYGKVALTGKATNFDVYFEPLKIWLSISVYCPKRGYFVAVFDNITERKRIEKEAQRRADQNALIYKVGQRVSGELELEAVLSEIVSAVRDAFDYHNVMLDMVDEEAGCMVVQSIVGAYVDFFPKDKLRIPIGKGMTGHAAATGKTQVSNDVSQDPIYIRDVEETKSELAVPIKRGEKVVGVLDIQSDKLNAFDEVDINTIETLSTQIAAAIENARLYKQAQRDITERKQAEEELEDIFNLSPNMVAVCTTEGKFLKVNPSWEKVLGYTTKEILDLGWAKLVHPDDVAKTNKEVEKQLKGRSVVNFINKFKCKDGSYKSLEWQATYSKEGIVHATARDITERKKAEKALEESEAMFNKAEEIAHIGTFKLEKPTNKIIWSGEMHRIFGIKPEEFDGSLETTINAIHPDDRERAVSVSEAAIRAKKPYQVEYRVVHPDGTEISVIAKAEAVYDERGELVEVVGTVQDITERKRAEEKLRLHSILLTKMDEGVYLIRASDGIIVYTNPALERMFGYDPDEMIGKNVSIVNAPTQKSPEKRAKEIQEVLNKTGKWEGEVNNIKKDGTSFWCYAIVSTFEHYEYGPVWISVHTNITDRKKAEEEIRSSREQLRNLAAHLQSAREEERKLIAREIHDELGQTLTALKMDVFWLAKRMPKDKRPFHEKTKSMSKLIDKTIQRIKRISAQLRPGLLDYLGLPAAIEWEAEEFQNRTGIKCEVNIDSEDIIMEQDHSTAIFRIFQETLTNVARHAKAKKIKVSLKEKAGKLELRVRDNGKGITENQVSNPKSFGLIGMRERALFLEGKVIIRGAQDKGTTIITTIPLPQKEKT